LRMSASIEPWGSTFKSIRSCDLFFNLVTCHLADAFHSKQLKLIVLLEENLL